MYNMQVLSTYENRATALTCGLELSNLAFISSLWPESLSSKGLEVLFHYIIHACNTCINLYILHFTLLLNTRVYNPSFADDILKVSALRNREGS